MSALKQEVHRFLCDLGAQNAELFLDEGKHRDHRSDVGGQVEAHVKRVDCIDELQGWESVKEYRAGQRNATKHYKPQECDKDFIDNTWPSLAGDISKTWHWGELKT